MEILNFTSGNQLLREQLERIDKQLSELNNLIEGYELEIRRRNDELSKKQGEMDMLNKKYDQLTSGRSMV
jgi:predicted nuclease with TOPRIM domain